MSSAFIWVVANALQCETRFKKIPPFSSLDICAAVSKRSDKVMPKDDNSKSEIVSQAGKVWFPWWKEASPATKNILVFVAGLVIIVALLCLYGPWKKEAATSQQAQTFSQTGPIANAIQTGAGATVQAVANSPGATVNFGTSEQTLRKIFAEKKSFDFLREHAARYPLGYILFGMADGHIITDSAANQDQLTPHWGDTRVVLDKARHTFTILFNGFSLSRGSKIVLTENHDSLTMNYEQDKPVYINYWLIGDTALFYEVLDEDNSVFLLALKKVK